MTPRAWALVRLVATAGIAAVIMVRLGTGPLVTGVRSVDVDSIAVACGQVLQVGVVVVALAVVLVWAVLARTGSSCVRRARRRIDADLRAGVLAPAVRRRVVMTSVAVAAGGAR